MNKYEKIEIVSFDDIYDVYDTIGIELMQLEDPTDYIAVYGKVDLIKELFTTIIGDGYDFGYADFDALDEMRKDMVYMMFIRGNCVISVEPAYSNNGVVMGHDAKVALFYMDDCKQDVIDYCVNRDMEVTLFDFDDCDCDEYECDCQKDIHIETDGDMHGFSVNNSGENGWSSYSFYSTDMDLVNEMAKRFR